MISHKSPLHRGFQASMHTLAKPATSFLDGVLTPSELKKLSGDELNSLACEIRQEIISSLAKTGGHLASNLGVVEITIAMHRFSPLQKMSFCGT